MTKLQVKVMSPEMFDSLPEYSMTNPTGLPVGKRWRRCEEWVEQVPMADGMMRVGRYRWLMAEVTREIVPKRDQWDRPLDDNGRPFSGPGNKDARLVEIKWRQIALTDGKGVWLP